MSASITDKCVCCGLPLYAGSAACMAKHEAGDCPKCQESPKPSLLKRLRKRIGVALFGGEGTVKDLFR